MGKNKAAVEKCYTITKGGRGQKQVCFWPNIMPISMARMREIAFLEFGHVDDSRLVFGAGVVCFWIELKPD